MADGTYRSNAYLTQAFIEKVDGIVASFDKGGYDPFLCAQDVPGSFATGKAVVSDNSATVVVHEIWNPETAYESVHDVVVTLRKVDGVWKIDNIVCGTAGVSEGPVPTVATPPIPAPPEEVAGGFYSWYVWYAREVGNPLADSAYHSSEHLTEDFIQKVDGIIASFDKRGYDPFLCAQDLPESFAIREAKVSGETATVQLVKEWNPGTSYQSTDTATVQLGLVDGKWLISDVWCLEGDPLAPIPEPPQMTTPEQTVQGFYDWYLVASAYDEVAGTRLSPLSDGQYRSSLYLTQGLVQKVDGIVASFDKGGFDPFLCAQDIPQDFTLEEVVVSGDIARVVVHTSFPGHGFTVALQQTDGQWQMSDVLCEVE